MSSKAQPSSNAQVKPSTQETNKEEPIVEPPSQGEHEHELPIPAPVVEPEPEPPVIAPVIESKPSTQAQRSLSGQLGTSKRRNDQDDKLNKPFRSVLPGVPSGNKKTRPVVPVPTKSKRPVLQPPVSPSAKRGPGWVEATADERAAWIAKSPDPVFAGRTRSQSRDGSQLSLSPTRATVAQSASTETYNLTASQQKPGSTINAFMPTVKPSSSKALIKPSEN